MQGEFNINNKSWTVYRNWRRQFVFRWLQCLSKRQSRLAAGLRNTSFSRLRISAHSRPICFPKSRPLEQCPEHNLLRYARTTRKIRSAKWLNSLYKVICHKKSTIPCTQRFNMARWTPVSLFVAIYLSQTSYVAAIMRQCLTHSWIRRSLTFREKQFVRRHEHRGSTKLCVCVCVCSQTQPITATALLLSFESEPRHFTVRLLEHFWTLKNH